jgi:hypothetical protein
MHFSEKISAGIKTFIQQTPIKTRRITQELT